MGPLSKIAAFFSSNTSLHNCSNNNSGPSAKELKKAASAAQQALKRRNRRNEWYYGEAGVPAAERLAATPIGTPMGGSSEDVRGRFSRKNPVWSSLRDLRSGRRHAQGQRQTVNVDVLRSTPSVAVTALQDTDLPRLGPGASLIRATAIQAALQNVPGDILRQTAPSLESCKSTVEDSLPRRKGGLTAEPSRVGAAPRETPPVDGGLPPSGHDSPLVSACNTPSASSAIQPSSATPPASANVLPSATTPTAGEAASSVAVTRTPSSSPSTPPRSPNADPKQRRPTSTPLQQQQSDDHNGRVQTEPVAKQNGVSAAPQPARRSLAASLRSSASPASPTAQTPSAQELAAQERKRLLPDLRHNAAAFEAMVVLLDYTTSKLGAFAAPALRKDVERIKAEMASTVLQLEEARAQQRLLESERAEQEERARAALAEVAEARAGQEQQQRDLDELRQRLSGHDHQVHKLSAAHADEVAALRGQLDARAVEAADAAAAATRGLREEYELELDRVTRRHEDTLRAALAAAREDAERQAQAQAQEAARREAELAAQLAAKEAAHEALREQSRRVMDSMKSDKDARTQALANRCRELQDEVDSLRSVLELRCDELQKSRRENDALRIAADQLPGAEQRISTLTARLEDLQVQLDRKGMLESKLLLENSELQQSFSKEIKEKQMLSLQNEQLQFKLKQNTEVVNVLAANMSDFHDVSSILNSSLTNSMTMTPDRGRRSAKGTSTINNNNRSTASPPESPRVKGVVEKSESVSYMLEMETDTPDDVVARIYRRMASTPVPSPHHAPHPRSAPPSARRSAALQQSASATTIPAQTSPARPTPKQRTTSASATSRTRSRSISSDSGECLSSGNWSPPASLPQLPSPPKQLEPPTQPHVAEARPENGLLAPGPGLGYDCSDIEDFSSSKSSSMSCSSEGSELGVGNKEHVEDEAGSDDGELAQQALFQQHQQDMMTASMTSCGSVTLPKDAGGEEMASGDDATNDIHSSCEEEDGSAGSCTGSDVDQDEDQGTRRARAEHRLAGLARLTLPTTPTAGCGQSAINTPLDSSWSEDMELPVSLSET